MQSIMTSPQLQPVTIQHQRVLTPTCQTIQTLTTAPTAVHAVQQQVQQVPVRNAFIILEMFSLNIQQIKDFSGSGFQKAKK